MRITMRTVTIAIAVLDAMACAAVVIGTVNSSSDPATIGFDYAAGVIVGGLFLVTGFPAFVMAYLRRAPRTALALALAFPAIFLVLFVAAVVVFASLR
jgi:hypothetical protein